MRLGHNKGTPTHSLITWHVDGLELISSLLHSSMETITKNWKYYRGVRNHINWKICYNTDYPERLRGVTALFVTLTYMETIFSMLLYMRGFPVSSMADSVVNQILLQIYHLSLCKYWSSLKNSLDQLIVTLYTLSIYPTVHNQLNRTILEGRAVVQKKDMLLCS